MDKEKEIREFAEWFLKTLSERCIKNCGKIMSAVQLPVFKKYLSRRIKRELQFYELCLDTASVLHEAGVRISEADIDEIMEHSIDLDNRLQRDIRFLPIRIEFDYKKILPLRKERTRRLVHLFMRLLATDDAKGYDDMVRKAFGKEEFRELNNEILELYAEEAFIINSSIKSLINVDTEELANRMYCSMLDVGIGLDREIADRIFNEKD